MVIDQVHSCTKTKPVEPGMENWLLALCGIFNLSYGNADYCEANLTTGWQYNFDDICDFTTAIPFWWEKLLQSSTYRNGLKCRWEELRQGAFHTDSVNYFIDSMANYLQDARIRNFQKWPIIGVYVNWNGFVGMTYQEDLNF